MRIRVRSNELVAEHSKKPQNQQHGDALEDICRPKRSEQPAPTSPRRTKDSAQDAELGYREHRYANDATHAKSSELVASKTGQNAWDDNTKIQNNGTHCDRE